MVAEGPMVGRDTELRRLRSLRQSGEQRAAVVIGPAGVGKSRLAREAATEAEADGTATLRITGTSTATPLPFGAFAPLLPPPETDFAAVGRRALIRRLQAALVERTGQPRFFLLVDDAHLLDDDSATLTHQLAASGSAFVLATVRTGEQAPKAVMALWETGLAEAVTLAGLAPDAVAVLLGHLLGGPIHEATVERLAEHSQGNVLFLRELVLGAVASGALRVEGGVHRLVGPLTPSDRLVELLEGRFASLAAPARTVLDLLALGEPLGPVQLDRMAEPAAVPSLEDAGLVTRSLDGLRVELRLAHPLYGEVLRARLPALRRRSVYRRLADTLEATGARRREDTLRLATWRLDGGGAVRADLMMAGARVARSRWALPRAERLARAALDAGAGFEAGLLLGQLYAFHGRAKEAETVLAGVLQTTLDDEQRALLATSRIYNLAAWGPLDEAERVADEADAALRDPRARDEVAASRALVLDLAGRTRDALDVVVPLLERAEGRALASAGFSGSVALGLAGRLDEAIRAADVGLDAYRRLAGPGLGIDAFMCASLRIAALTFAGRLDEATTWGAAEYETAVAGGSVGARAFLSMYLARPYLARGRVQTAERHAQEAVGLYRAGGFLTLLLDAAIPLAQAWALVGRVDEARRLFGELEKRGLGPERMHGAELLQAQAWTDVAAGDLDAGRRRLAHAAEHARTNGDIVLESATLHDLCRLGEAETVVSRLQELTKAIDGDLAAARAAHATAAAERDAGGLCRASVAFEALGADLLAAEAAAQAADAFRAGGDPDGTGSAERRAALLAARCEGAITPLLRALPVD